MPTEEKRVYYHRYCLWANLWWKGSSSLHFHCQIHLAYGSYIGRFEKAKEGISHCVVKQCYYCENLFTKNDEKMKKHVQVCAAREGITYIFENGLIISFQDNFKYLGDIPFTVYFDFEITTRASVSFCLSYLEVTIVWFIAYTIRI